jgi:hypothetical protein
MLGPTPSAIVYVKQIFLKRGTKNRTFSATENGTFCSLTTPLSSCLERKDLAEGTRMAQETTKDASKGGLDQMWHIQSQHIH